MVTSMSVKGNDIFSPRPSLTPSIYVYSLSDVASHNGYLKIGMTTRSDKQRIKEQTHTAGLKPNALYVTSAVKADGTTFTDHDIHKILRRKGFKRLYDGEDKNEWYKCSLNDVKAAILELKEGIKTEGNRTLTFKMRPEQVKAVEVTKNYFEKEHSQRKDHSPKFLWNCKMRFGKTFASYQLAKAMGLKRILILTFKPAVESAWEEDLESHVDFKGWQFVSDKIAKDEHTSLDEEFDKCDKDKPIVVFGSFQNLLGTNDSGGIKAKNEFIHANNWDIIIFDEYHYGAWRDNAKKLFENQDEEDIDFDSEKYQEEEYENKFDETFLPITSSYYLYLSGTPFRAINNGEFVDDQIFSWTYSDEQREKEKYTGEDNPYASLPKMVMMTYKLDDKITNVAKDSEFNEFDLNEFFKAEDKGLLAHFKHQNEVQMWLDLIHGQYSSEKDIVDNLKDGEKDKPVMPFSDVRLLNILTHTVWFLPDISSCDAMENLLHMKQNSFYHDYEIVNCSGTKAGVGLDALKPVRRAMNRGDKSPLQTKTITLSCGKLLTGVTIRPWTGIFMLRNLKSPETYFQAAFRVQSPWTIKDEYDKEIILKNNAIFLTLH